jgi:hypothetical protein
MPAPSARISLLETELRLMPNALAALLTLRPCASQTLMVLSSWARDNKGGDIMRTRHRYARKDAAALTIPSSEQFLYPGKLIDPPARR